MSQYPLLLRLGQLHVSALDITRKHHLHLLLVVYWNNDLRFLVIISVRHLRERKEVEDGPTQSCDSEPSAALRLVVRRSCVHPEGNCRSCTEHFIQRKIVSNVEMR